VFFLPLFFDTVWIKGVAFGDISPISLLRFYDSSFYMTIAHTLYDPAHTFFEEFPAYSGVMYLTNHFPIFPLIIRFFSLFMPTTMAGLVANEMMSVVGTVLIFTLFLQFMKPKEALVLSVFQLLFPVRALIWHHIANSEPTYMVFLTLSVLCVVKKKYWWALLAAVIAQATRPISIVLFPSFFILALLEKNNRVPKVIASLCIPLTFIAIELWFYKTIPGFTFAGRPGGFSGLIGTFPFANMFNLNFNADGSWYLIFAMIVGLVTLIKNRNEDVRFLQLAAISFPMVYLSVFINHHDISRYVWPFLPFVVFIPLKNIFLDRRVQIAFCIMLPAIFFAAWGALVTNQMPIAHLVFWLQAVGE